MKVKVFVFGTLFLIGNITLSAHQVVSEGFSFSTENAQKRLRQGVRADLEDILRERGLEEEAISALMKNFLKEKTSLSMIKVEHYLETLEGVAYNALLQQMATRLLFGKSIDLNSYETLVAMSQTLLNGRMQPHMYEKLSHVASRNQSLDVA